MWVTVLYFKLQVVQNRQNLHRLFMKKHIFVNTIFEKINCKFADFGKEIDQ